MIIICLIIMAISVLLGLFLSPFFFGIALLAFAALLCIFIKNILSYYVRLLLEPFKFLYRLFTNSLPNSYYDVNGEYESKAQFIIFGIIGRISYFVILISAFFFLVSFKPYKEGYIYKQAELSYGDEVVVKINNTKEIGYIESFSQDEIGRVFTTVSINGVSKQASFSTFDTFTADGYIKGLYIENNDSAFTHFIKSAWSWVLYEKERSSLIINLATSDA